VNYVKVLAQANGWESYEVTKQKEVIVMPASVKHGEKHVFADSVTEKKPNGQELTHGNAMSLAAWTKKTKQEVYDAFLLTYVEVAEEKKEPVAKEPVVRKTAAEKQKEKEEKAEKASQVKKENADKREAEKQKKKEAKEEAAKVAKAEKAAKPAKAEKAEKAEKPAKAEKAEKVEKAEKPAKAEKAETPVKAEKPAKAPSAPTKAKPAVAKKEEWTCENDGMLHDFPFKGKEYLRNYDNEVFAKTEEGERGAWCGIFVVAENRIDDSVAEPEFVDEE
jgi:membrane protein involved in colicin uptake